MHNCGTIGMARWVHSSFHAREQAFRMLSECIASDLFDKWSYSLNGWLVWQNSTAKPSQAHRKSTDHDRTNWDHEMAEQTADKYYGPPKKGSSYLRTGTTDDLLKGIRLSLRKKSFSPEQKFLHPLGLSRFVLVLVFSQIHPVISSHSATPLLVTLVSHPVHGRWFSRPVIQSSQYSSHHIVPFRYCVSGPVNWLASHLSCFSIIPSFGPIMGHNSAVQFSSPIS